MMTTNEFNKFGEQLGQFLRGLLQIPSTLQSAERPGKKYILVDCTETSTGSTASIDLVYDEAEIAKPFSSDVIFRGVVQFASGATLSVEQIIAKDYANALSLQKAPTGLNVWHIVADGDLQPPSKKPYEVTFSERPISGTSVMRVSGQIFDPNIDKRVNFAITHDPVEIVIIGVVAGLAVLICGAIILVEASKNNCIARAQAQCGDRGVRKITLHRTYGFGWIQGGPEVGCGERCDIECNP